MIRDLRPSGKGIGTGALKNHEIAFGKSAFQRHIKRLHHGNVENVERWPVERNPRRAMFEPKLDRFLHGGHDGRGASTGRLLALKLWRPLFEKRPNSLVAVLRQITTNLFPDFIIESPGKFLFLAGK